MNIKGLNLFSKSYPDENGVCFNIGINNFLYPNFYNTSLNFEDLDFNMAIGLDGQKLAISVNLPKLNLINKDYRVILSDLNLNILLHDIKLSDYFTTKKLQPVLEDFIKNNPVMEVFFNKSKNDLIYTRGIWKLP